MIPGLVSKRSERLVSLEATVTCDADILRVTATTSTTVLATLTPRTGGFSQQVTIINSSGNNITTVTTGNIQTAKTLGVDVAIIMTYSKTSGKWYPGALA